MLEQHDWLDSDEGLLCEEEEHKDMDDLESRDSDEGLLFEHWLMDSDTEEEDLEELEKEEDEQEEEHLQGSYRASEKEE